MVVEVSKRSETNPLRVIHTLTFRDWWHLLARYTSTVESKDTTGTILKIMAHRGFRHLPLVDDGNVVGVVTAGGLVELFVGEQDWPSTDSKHDISIPPVEADLDNHGNYLVSTLHNSASSIATPDPVTISPDETILDAIRILAEKNIGSLLIVETQREPRTLGRLVGIVTLRDIVSILAAYGPFRIRVEECMTKTVVTVNDSTCIYSAMKQMARENVRRLPVLSEGSVQGMGRSAIGMVTNKMILRYLESIISFKMLGVGKALGQPVKNVMQSGMPLIDQHEDCGNVAYLMRELGTGGFAVVGSDGLLGVITERDLIRKIYQREGISFFSDLFEKGDFRIRT
jgi:CBS domain-containing protein